MERCGWSNAQCCWAGKYLKHLPLGVVKGGDHDRCSRWHMPPAYDPVLWEQYQECDTFCVVRHPVERMISHWKFRNDARDCNQEALSRWILPKLSSLKSNRLLQDCHFLPQVDYVFSTNYSFQSGLRTCKHVLRSENLSAEWNALLVAYGYTDVPRLPATVNSRHCKISAPTDVERLIREIYADDFKVFGYT